MVTMKLLPNVLYSSDLVTNIVTNIVLYCNNLSYVTLSHHHHQQPQSVPVVTLWTPHHTTWRIIISLSPFLNKEEPHIHSWSNPIFNLRVQTWKKKEGKKSLVSQP